MKSRKLITVLGSVVVATLLGGCSATVYSSTSSAATDDLYVTHNRKAIAAEKQQRLIRQQEAQRAAEEAERARREEVARAVSELNDRQEDESRSILIAGGYGGDSYASRLKSLGSLSDDRQSDVQNENANTSGRYASAYDPAYYDVTVLGDQVLVEPKYAPSLYGDWGTANVNINLGLWGWSSPAWNWSSSAAGLPENIC